MKDISDKDLKSLAEKMEPEGIAKMKKCLKQAEAHQKKAAAKKSEERKAITKVGNSEEASEMQHAIFMWDEALVQKALGKRLKVPKGTNGAMLVMEEVEWPTKGAASKWEKMLEDVTWEWCKSQVDADKPFMPPEKAKKHCVYLWDQKETDAFLDKIKAKKVGLLGKDLMDDVARSGAFDDLDDSDEVWDKLQEECVRFVKDIVENA